MTANETFLVFVLYISMQTQLDTALLLDLEIIHGWLGSKERATREIGNHQNLQRGGIQREGNIRQPTKTSDHGQRETARKQHQQQQLRISGGTG